MNLFLRPFFSPFLAALLSVFLFSCSKQTESGLGSSEAESNVSVVQTPPSPPDPTRILASSITGIYDANERREYSVTQKGGPSFARSPYIGAIAVEAESGRILFEDQPEALALPASMTKMMLLLLIQERIEAGQLSVQSIVSVSRRAFETGGSQVYLDPRESFPVEDLLYALMIQSANDAAVALAEHVAGSCEAMVELMNRRATELGMLNTHFESVHGLPSKVGLPNDITTPRDMAVLSVELCKHPDVFHYTGTNFRLFRPSSKQPFEMRTHNPFLQQKVPGCDGLKTGYTKRAGYSVAVSVVRNGKRILVITMGCPDKSTRDAKIREILTLAESALLSPS